MHPCARFFLSTRKNERLSPVMEHIAKNILETIGNTPLVRINRMNTGAAEVAAKVESFNPGSSSKDRIEQAKEDWQRNRFGQTVPGDETEFIPLPPPRA